MLQERAILAWCSSWAARSSSLGMLVVKGPPSSASGVGSQWSSTSSNQRQIFFQRLSFLHGEQRHASLFESPIYCNFVGYVVVKRVPKTASRVGGQSSSTKSNQRKSSSSGSPSSASSVDSMKKVSCFNRHSESVIPARMQHWHMAEADIEDVRRGDPLLDVFGGWGHVVGKDHILLRVHSHLPPVWKLRSHYLTKWHRRLPHSCHGLARRHERVGGFPPAVNARPLCDQHSHQGLSQQILRHMLPIWKA